MKSAAILLCGVSLFAVSLTSHEGHLSKKVAKSIHFDRVYLDVDRVKGDKVWFRINNESEFDIWVMNLPSPLGCEDFTEYYLERLIQRRFSDDARTLVQKNPVVAEKDNEFISRNGLPRTIAIREERQMHWSDGIAAGCGTVAAKRKGTFQVPLQIAQEYDKLYVVYYYNDGDPVSVERAPEHRLYFDLASLKQHAPTN